MRYLDGVVKESSTFRDFIKNSAIKKAKQREVIDSFGLGGLSQVSLNFLYNLIDAGRLIEYLN